MVFFTCSTCGTALKKKQVEGHFGCSRNFSCMDCQKDFSGNEYKAHTKCISEEEKYNGPDWKAPSSQNKGERKQAAWVETVNSVLEIGKESMSPKKVALLKMIAERDNVPRKKTKFLNFVSNVAKNGFDSDTVEAVWELLEAEWKRTAELNTSQTETLTAKETTSGGPVLTETGDNVVSNGTEDADVNGPGTVQENGECVAEKEINKKKSKKSKRKKEQEDQLEKNGTVLDNGENDVENQDNIGKSKKKKRKNDNDEVGGNETVQENNSEDVESKSKKGKSKKSKLKEDEVEKTEVSLDNGQDVTEGDEKVGKSKKRKGKKEKGEEVGETDAGLENGKDVAENDDNGKKSKKKKGKTNGDVDQNENVQENGGEDAITESAMIGKSKKNKRKKDEEVEPEVEVKKKKKSKAA